MSSLITYAAITILTLCGLCILLHPLQLCVEDLMNSVMQKQDLCSGTVSEGPPFKSTCAYGFLFLF